MATELEDLILALRDRVSRIRSELATAGKSDEISSDQRLEYTRAVTELTQFEDQLRKAAETAQTVDEAITDNVIRGNPGDGTLHSMLSDAADHVDYEASVVESAADEIEDDEIAELAHDQADAMEEAADALDDAAEAAADTAAEVFTDTGTAQDDDQADPNIEDVRDGNPTRGEYGTRERQEELATDLRRVLGTIEDGDAEREDWNELDNIVTEVVETMQAGDWFAGVEIPLNRAIEVEKQHAALEGNPGEGLIPEQTEPIPDSGHVELVPESQVPAAPTPTPATADTGDSSPEPSHWYTRTLRGNRS